MSSWIKNTEYVPFWKKEDPETKDKYGMTIPMLWIIYVKTEPPEWMKHDPTIQDDYGVTLAMIWVYTVRTDPPLWMKHDLTIQKIWINY